MTDHFAFLALGLGNGAVYAALGLALVMTYKSSGVVNFATGAVALYAAYTYAYLRQGELLNPIPGLEPRIDLGGRLGVLPAMVVAVVIASALGVVLYLLIFRWMRTSPLLARAVAAIPHSATSGAPASSRAWMITRSASVHTAFSSPASRPVTAFAPGPPMLIVGAPSRRSVSNQSMSETRTARR